MPVVYTKTDQSIVETVGTGAPVHSANKGDKYTDVSTGDLYIYTTSWQKLGSSATWGSITGTLSDQTDLQNALNAKQDTLGFTPENVGNKATTMTGNTTSNILYLTAKAVYDWAIGLFVPTTRTLTINGTSFDLSANRSWTVSSTTQFADIQVSATDETNVIAPGLLTTFRMIRATTLTSVRASLSVAQSTGSIFTVDIRRNGVSILSTLITIDNTELTSTTAVTLPVLSTLSLADNDEMTIHCTQVGDSTAKGLKVQFLGTYT